MIKRKYLSYKKLIMLIVPVIVLLTTYFIFKIFVGRYGMKLGYFLGFVFYWIVWCFIFPLFIIGIDGIKNIFRKVSNPFGKPAWLGLLVLLIPPFLAGSTAFVKKFNIINSLILLGSLGLAIINATGEEILWRGVYNRIFPKNVILGYIYPSIGFAIWHISPQTIHVSSMPGGIYSFLFGALVLGLCWGWVVWKTKSIIWAVLSHILTDFFGLGATIYFTINI